MCKMHAVCINTPRVNLPKVQVADPTPFNGTKSKFQTFLDELYLLFRAKPYEDRDKITIILSYMKGGYAGEWKKAMSKKLDEYEKNPITKRDPFPTYNYFVEEITKIFGDHNEEQTAQEKLERMTQGTRSV